MINPENAEVVDIILNDTHPDYQEVSDIGKIKFRRVITDFNINKESLSWAKPLNPYAITYPLIYETVLIFYGPTEGVAGTSQNSISPYYLTTNNVWNRLNHNAVPLFTHKYVEEDKQTLSGFTGNVPTSNSSDELKFGDIFEENPNVKQLQPYEGDIIYQSRFGSSIRLTSITKNNPWSKSGDIGSPLIIIRNQKTPSQVQNDKLLIEDINKDSASIYITDGQQIPIKLVNTANKSFNNKKAETEKLDKPSDYTEGHIIISANKLTFQASKENLMLNAKNTIAIGAKNINIDADKSISLDASKIGIGSGAKDAAILGDVLKDKILKPFLQEVAKMQVATAFGPAPLLPQHITAINQLIAKLDTILSKKVFIE